MPSVVVINTDGESSEIKLSPDKTEKDIKKFLIDSLSTKTKKQLNNLIIHKDDLKKIKQHILNKEKEEI